MSRGDTGGSKKCCWGAAQARNLLGTKATDLYRQGGLWERQFLVHLGAVAPSAPFNHTFQC